MWVITNLEESIELAHKEILCSCKVVTGCNAESKVWVLQHIGNVRDNVLFIHTHTQYLKK